MRVIRNTGQNVSPSDDGRLFDQAFTDGLFNSPSITSLGANLVQIGSMYGILCGRDFTADAQQINVELPTADTATGYIYIKYDTATDDIISVESTLAPFTVTYEDINTSGTVCEMIIATYTASSVAVTSLTANYPKAQTEINSTLEGSIAVIETEPATANHAYNTYIIYNGQLYRTTTTITAGTTLSGKITPVTVGDELIATRNSITYMDVSVTVTSGGTFQINSATGNVVSWTNFLNAYVIDSNYSAIDIYTYNNLLYGSIRNFESFAHAGGTYKIRIWYKA